MPTTTATAPPEAERRARSFAHRVTARGWNTDVTHSVLAVPARVVWRVTASNPAGSKSITFAWSTVTQEGLPRTTRYTGGLLQCPDSATEADKRTTLRTIAQLNAAIASL